MSLGQRPKREQAAWQHLDAANPDRSGTGAWERFAPELNGSGLGGEPCQL